MGKLSRFATNFRIWWMTGAVAAMIVALSLLMFGLIAFVALIPFEAILDWPDGRLEKAHWGLAVVWAPLGIGYAITMRPFRDILDHAESEKPARQFD